VTLSTHATPRFQLSSISQLRPYALALALGVLCFFYYGNTIDLPEDTHDGDTLIDNSRIRADPLFFFSPNKAQSTGRPVAELTKFVVGLPFGDDLRPFHVANILLHIANALLLAWLVVRLTRDAHLAVLTALLFALTPMHHQAIHHMSAMDYLLSGAFALGAIHAILGKRLGWALVLAVLSILSHAASFAPLVLLALWTQHRYRYIASLAFFALAFFALEQAPDSTSTGHALRSWLAGAQGVWDFFRTCLWLSGRHATTLLWHIPPLLSFETWEIWAGAGVALIALIAVWRGTSQTRFLVLLTAAAIAPYGFMYTDIAGGYSGGSARYRYLSAMGACWLGGAVCVGALRRLRQPITVGTAVLVLLVATLTYQAGRQTYMGSIHSAARSKLSSKDSLVGTELMLQAIRSPHNRLLDIEDMYMRLSAVAHFTMDDPQAFLAEATARYPNNYTLQIAALTARAAAGERSAYIQIKKMAFELDNVGAVAASMFNNIAVAHAQRSEYEQAITAYVLAYDSDPQERFQRRIEELRAKL
jgi:hypothetical protein